MSPLETIFWVGEGRTVVVAVDGCASCLDAFEHFLEAGQEPEDRIVVLVRAETPQSPAPSAKLRLSRGRGGAQDGSSDGSSSPTTPDRKRYTTGEASLSVACPERSGVTLQEKKSEQGASGRPQGGTGRGRGLGLGIGPALGMGIGVSMGPGMGIGVGMVQGRIFLTGLGSRRRAFALGVGLGPSTPQCKVRNRVVVPGYALVDFEDWDGASRATLEELARRAERHATRFEALRVTLGRQGSKRGKERRGGKEEGAGGVGPGSFQEAVAEWCAELEASLLVVAAHNHRPADEPGASWHTQPGSDTWQPQHIDGPLPECATAPAPSLTPSCPVLVLGGTSDPTQHSQNQSPQSQSSRDQSSPSQSPQDATGVPPEDPQESMLMHDLSFDAFRGREAGASGNLSPPSPSCMSPHSQHKLPANERDTLRTGWRIPSLSKGKPAPPEPASGSGSGQAAPDSLALPGRLAVMYSLAAWRRTARAAVNGVKARGQVAPSVPRPPQPGTGAPRACQPGTGAPGACQPGAEERATKGKPGHTRRRSRSMEGTPLPSGTPLPTGTPAAAVPESATACVAVACQQGNEETGKREGGGPKYMWRRSWSTGGVRLSAESGVPLEDVESSLSPYFGRTFGAPLGGTEPAAEASPPSCSGFPGQTSTSSSSSSALSSSCGDPSLPASLADSLATNANPGSFAGLDASLSNSPATSAEMEESNDLKGRHNGEDARVQGLRHSQSHVQSHLQSQYGSMVAKHFRNASLKAHLPREGSERKPQLWRRHSLAARQSVVRRVTAACHLTLSPGTVLLAYFSPN